MNEWVEMRARVRTGDVEISVGEFRKFLKIAVDGDGKSQSTTLGIK